MVGRGRKARQGGVDDGLGQRPEQCAYAVERQICCSLLKTLVLDVLDIALVLFL